MDCVFILKKIGFIGNYIKTWPQIRHTYTHFHLHLRPHYFDFIENRNRLKYYDESAWLDLNSIESLPIHRAMQKIIFLVYDDLKVIAQ